MVCVLYNYTQLESKLQYLCNPSRSSICLDPRPDIHKVITTPLQQNPPEYFLVGNAFKAHLKTLNNRKILCLQLLEL